MLPCYHADCAVCTENYAPGLGRRCIACSGRNAEVAVTFSTMSLLLVLLGGVLGAIYLLQRVGADAHQEQNQPRRSWQGKLKRVRVFIGKVIPLSAIRIVVVVVQIVIQVCAVEEPIQPNRFSTPQTISNTRLPGEIKHRGLQKRCEPTTGPCFVWVIFSTKECWS